jgi:hypothetical protein
MLPIVLDISLYFVVVATFGNTPHNRSPLKIAIPTKENTTEGERWVIVILLCHSC